jgi:hypothetical protein
VERAHPAAGLAGGVRRLIPAGAPIG